MRLIKAHKPRGIWRACAILRQRGVGVYTITYENISTWTRVAYAYLPTARTRTIQRDGTRKVREIINYTEVKTGSKNGALQGRRTAVIVEAFSSRLTGF